MNNTTNNIATQVLSFQGEELATIMIDEVLYFVGSDLARALGYKKPNNAINQHVRDEDKTRKRIKYKGQHRTVTLINEIGVSTLISNSVLLTTSQKKVLRETWGLDGALVSRKEIEFLQLLEEVISPLGFTLERQYVVGNYRLDGLIPELGLAIEYDEAHHKRQKDKDKERELYIQNEIGCTFVRVSEDERDSVNVGYVMKAIIENL